MSKIGNVLLDTYNLGHHPDDADFEWWEWYGNQPFKKIWRKEMASKILSLCPPTKTTLVLGCGSSPLTGMFMGKVVGLDINPWKIRFVEAKLPTVRFVQRDIRDPVDSLGKFDLIVASEVFEHIPLVELKVVISKFCRLLSETGAIVVAAPSYDTGFGTFMETLMHDYHYRFSFRTLSTLFASEGLSLVGTRHFFWDRVVCYRRENARQS